MSHSPIYTIVAVSRGNEFSPNHVDNDTAIFMATVDCLRSLGHSVAVYPEEEFLREEIKGQYIVSMARDHRTIAYLHTLEKAGSVIVNSPQGVDNCIRQPMTELLLGAGVPHPVSYIVDTNTPFAYRHFPYWIKRGDAHAMIKEDVVFVETLEEANQALQRLAERGILQAVINEHLVGDLVKFYGVADTDFFYSFYPTEQSHSKFGLEAINGEAKGYPLNVQRLQAIANQAAQTLHTPIYGGDCVVSSTGEIRLIDFNDWPSFARCKELAAPAIAEGILLQFHQQALS